jgi:hypothetical protein
MNKKIISAVVIAVAVVGLGLFMFFKKTQPQPASEPATSAPITTQQPVTTPATKTLVIPLSSQNNSGEAGTATLTDVDGKTNVSISLSGAPASTVQPAHIHTGTCAAIGGVSYTLTFPVNGKSETTLNVLLDDLLKKLPLAINVHKSASEANIYVACGDISNTSTSNSSTVNQPAATTAPAVENNRSGAGSFSTPTDNRKGAGKVEN